MDTGTLQGLPLQKVIADSRAETWRRGKLAYLLLKGGQQRAYEAITAWQKDNPGDSGPAVLHCHRGLGKTALLVLLGLEEALRHPGALVRIGGPTAKEIHKAADASLLMFLRKRPADIEVDTIDDGFRIYNPKTMAPGEFSELTLFGCRELGNAERGYRATWIGLDEVRNIDDCEYVINSVLRPMFARMPRRFMVLSSTSPQVGSHAFWQFANEAERCERLMFIPYTENPDFSARSEEELTSIFGPPGSVSRNREGLCKKAADESLLVIPSFTRNRASIVNESIRPEYCYPFNFGDMGFVDCAAFLFCFIDFDRQKLCVEREIVGSSIGTAELNQRILQMEHDLWATLPNRDRLRRWCDATPRELADFKDAGLYFSPARSGDEAWDKWRGLARLESAFACCRIEINPLCKSLIYQLENSTKNKLHDDLQREVPRSNADPSSPVMGHADALWALCYGVWQIRNSWLLTPYPKDEPLPGTYRGGLIERKRMAKENQPGRVVITERPLVVNDFVIPGADPKGRQVPGRRVSFR